MLIDGGGLKLSLRVRGRRQQFYSHCTKNEFFHYGSVHVTKSARNCGFGHICWRKPYWKTSFFVQCPYDVWLVSESVFEYIFEVALSLIKTFKSYKKQLLDKSKYWTVDDTDKFSITDFFSRCDQIRWKLRIWSHLLKKSLMENFIFCAVWAIFQSYRKHFN